MLNERGVSYTLREYTTDPLTQDELRAILTKLKIPARELLRMREAKNHALSGEEPEEVLIAKMASYPKLVNRPIAVDGERALLARPADALNDWLP